MPPTPTGSTQTLEQTPLANQMTNHIWEPTPRPTNREVTFAPPAKISTDDGGGGGHLGAHVQGEGRVCGPPAKISTDDGGGGGHPRSPRTGRRKVCGRPAKITTDDGGEWRPSSDPRPGSKESMRPTPSQGRTRNAHAEVHDQISPASPTPTWIIGGPSLAPTPSSQGRTGIPAEVRDGDLSTVPPTPTWMRRRSSRATPAN